MRPAYRRAAQRAGLLDAEAFWLKMAEREPALALLYRRAALAMKLQYSTGKQHCVTHLRTVRSCPHHHTWRV